MKYNQQIECLHRAVVHGERSNVLPLIAPTKDEITAAERLAVYADGYHHRLENVVFSDFPTLAHLMGEKPLRALIKTSVRHTLSQNWDLSLFSPHFAEFMVTTDALRTHKEMAQLEAAIASVFWMNDSTPLSVDALTQLDEEAFAHAHFKLRPASTLLAFSYDVNRYLTVFRECDAADALTEQNEYILVVRHNNQVQRHMLDSDEYAILAALSEDRTFGEALSAVENAESAQEKLPDYIGRWLEHGFFQAF